MGENYENTEMDGVVGTVEDTAEVSEGKKGFGAGAIAIAAAVGAGVCFGVSKLVGVIKRKIKKNREEKQAAELAKAEADKAALEAIAAKSSSD